MSNTIAVFQISTEEDLRFQLDFTGLVLAGRTLRVNVRERASNALKVSLEAPTNLTLVGDGNLTVFYGKAGMAGWARTEYEADIVDETGGSFTRIMAVRFVYDAPGNLVYGVRGNQATVKWGGNQAVVTAIGGVGPPGPANSLTIGDVETLETGEDATASIDGAAPNQALNLGLPKGNTGNKGWAPVFGLAADGERFVFVLAGWVGGEGDPPPVTSGGDPLYVGAAGYTTDIAAGFDTRGMTGDIGPKGDKGWAPKLVAVPDGARRVLRVVDWIGGEGVKPPAGDYLGDGAYVTDIADAVDFRGPAGSVIEPGGIDTGDLADGILSADTEGRGKMADGYIVAEHIGDEELAALAGLTSAADKLPYFTGSGTAALATLTEFMRTVLSAADAEAARATIGASLSRGSIAGLVLANNATTPNSQIDISTGQARDSTDTYDLRLAVGITVDLTASGANGLDTGSVAAGASYHIYIIRRSSDGVLAGLASTSSTSPSMPSGYVGFRRLGAVLTDGSGNVRSFKQFGNLFQFTDPVNDIASSPHGAIGLRTLSVPSGIKVKARLLMITAADSVGVIVAWDPDRGVPLNGNPYAVASRNLGSQAPFGFTIDVTTNASQQVYTGDGGTNAYLNLYTQGWEDYRDEYL